VVSSGRFTMGAHVSAFEKAFAEEIGTRYAVMCNSGSSANLLMVAAYTLRFEAGTVIAPVLSWPTSYSPFQQYGWKINFVDIDDSLTLDCIEAKSRAEFYERSSYAPPVVLAVNILGNACEFSHFGYLPPTILEDNCESLGATYQGKRTGSFGVMASHSFFFAHHLSTMEGGMVTTNDEYFYNMLLSLRSHGWTRHLPKDNPLRAKVADFEFIYPGYNVRPMELQGAIGLKQLAKLEQIVKMRRENAARFPFPKQREIGESSWFGFAVKKTEQIERCCETRPVVTGNFLRSPSAKYYRVLNPNDAFPVADRITDEYVYIGNHGRPIDWAQVFHD